MRIVGGRHRGRRLIVPPGSDIRPSADRLREALFNILEHAGFGEGGTSVVRDAIVLDAFCGTGALGFEALSRGAAAATMMDTNRAALDSVQRLAGLLGEADRVSVLRQDAASPGPARRPHSLVFLDPPYGKGLAGSALSALALRGWIGENAIVSVETGAREHLEPPEDFERLDERRYGAARITLMRFRPD